VTREAHHWKCKTCDQNQIKAPHPVAPACTPLVTQRSLDFGNVLREIFTRATLRQRATMCLSVRPSVRHTSQWSSTEMDERLDLVFGIEAIVPQCVKWNPGISRNGDASIWNSVANSGLGKISPLPVDRRKCCQLNSTDNRCLFITPNVNQSIDQSIIYLLITHQVVKQ